MSFVCKSIDVFIGNCNVPCDIRIATHLTKDGLDLGAAHLIQWRNNRLINTSCGRAPSIDGHTSTDTGMPKRTRKP